MTAAFTIRLDDEMLAKLDALAADTDRSRNWIATKAIESYVELNAWQIEQIKAGIAEADRGEGGEAAGEGGRQPGAAGQGCGDSQALPPVRPRRRLLRPPHRRLERG